MTSERDVQRAIIEALVWDGWMILRVNQGGAYQPKKCTVCNGAGCRSCNWDGVKYVRYTRFAWWQALGIDPQDSGFSDVIAVKWVRDTSDEDGDGNLYWEHKTELLAIEVKAPGRKAKVTHAQSHFLAAIEAHGGIAIIADSLDDVAPYLDKVQVE